ncbi:EAL domain-containing protein [Pseudomonas sp. 10B1]|uniref:putative bifunctional diguanylate cyclase/phosphodiesterase n=1 Tax=unclassified Pseudomonas TaxID=196821 RepID=UPI002AB43B18|nr:MULTISPECIES: EAL domain-containing protein [unclassified Pseudomonas]MDY7561664.1 EAL domain-containing protein [Pseudomonas sp. AB6]MEA9978186.1 EAL domain-containing protein [Pseudomonas sp. RTS4]MEA9994629.1 EAL domain-containing protein [Pseudomonas sp. AA4]MEB0085774.1 EAL domain-containing protein [Pseudomonas sp. RTI1]MEB0125901.1 EAL domain-containing protein [Pseudomonas sp. CCC1.2]
MNLRSSFQARIACVLILLMLVVIGAVYFAVKVATDNAVRIQAEEQLEVGTRVFQSLLDIRGRQLRDGVQLVAADFGFRDAVASGDSATIRSVLLNHGARINASDMFLLSMDGKVLASTVDQIPEGSQFRFDEALRQIRNSPSALIVPLDGKPHLLVESTVLAPLPIGRVVMGFAIDIDFAQELRSLSGLEVSFLAVDSQQSGQMVSTQPDSLYSSLNSVMLDTSQGRQMHLTQHMNQRFLSQSLALVNSGNPEDGQVIALLQSPVDRAMQAFASLDEKIIWIALAALLASLAGALLLARNVSLPVRALAQAAERIGEGDYQTPLVLERSDELGRLASAFNLMQSGIAEREQQLAHNALHDTLTGLPNRALAMERLGSSIAAERPVALLYLDIVNFRAINESIGAEGVDHMLQGVSARVQAVLRPGDTVARLTANEFLLLLENTSSDGAVAMADKLQQLLLKPQRIGSHDLSLDCCVGIAVYPADGAAPQELLSRAAIARQDAALLPGRLQIYQQGRDVAHQRQISLIRDLRHAAANNELVLHYQPKLDIRQGRVRQAEALLRWQHPQFGLVSPLEFIVLAERTGSIHLLTHWVIEEVMRQWAQWNRRGLQVQISLNISADDLLSDELVGRVSALLHQYQVPADQLIFEITESAVMREPEHALKVLHLLRECGISLSVDDFGTGYSSLAHLKRLPVQELKIDQSFVRDLDETSEDAVIVRSTIEMSHNLGLKVVAEGVEYERSLRLLERWHCDTAQGYLISRPLTAAAFEVWIAQPLSPLSLMVH